WRGLGELLMADSPPIALEGQRSRKPLIHQHSQRILIARQAWLVLELLRGGIGGCPSKAWHGPMGSLRLEHARQAKISQKKLIPAGQQQIGWLDVQVHHALVMSILHPFCCLLQIGEKRHGRLWLAWHKLIFQGTLGQLHHQVGGVLLKGETEYPHNMRMVQGGNGAGFFYKPLELHLIQMGMEDFDRYLRLEVDVFAN